MAVQGIHRKAEGPIETMRVTDDEHMGREHLFIGARSA
jgi:hypothetical protein